MNFSSLLSMKLKKSVIGSGDEIVIGPGSYQENIDLEGKNLTLTSINPNDPTIVATTVINGTSQCQAVTLSRGQGSGCVLAGLIVTGGIVGISCGAASPTISNCTIESTTSNSIEFMYGYQAKSSHRLLNPMLKKGLFYSFFC